MTASGVAYEHGACIALLSITSFLITALAQLAKDKASPFVRNLDQRMALNKLRLKIESGKLVTTEEAA